MRINFNRRDGLGTVSQQAGQAAQAGADLQYLIGRPNTGIPNNFDQGIMVREKFCPNDFWGRRPYFCRRSGIRRGSSVMA